VSDKKDSYAAAGVNYDVIDPGKRLAQAKALETKDPAAAAAARARAIGLLEQAMAVQAGVIASAAPEGSSAPNPAASAAPAPPKAPGAP